MFWEASDWRSISKIACILRRFSHLSCHPSEYKPIFWSFFVPNGESRVRAMPKTTWLQGVYNTAMKIPSHEPVGFPLCIPRLIYQWYCSLFLFSRTFSWSVFVEFFVHCFQHVCTTVCIIKIRVVIYHLRRFPLFMNWAFSVINDFWKIMIGLVGSTWGDFENSLTTRPESHISFTQCSHQSHQAYTGVQSCVAFDLIFACKRLFCFAFSKMSRLMLVSCFQCIFSQINRRLYSNAVFLFSVTVLFQKHRYSCSVHHGRWNHWAFEVHVLVMK